MPLKLDQFHRQIAGEPRPVYLIAGEEHLLVLEAADALRARARELGYTEREVLDADENGFDWDELARQGASLSLFASRKLIDLRLPTGKPGKEGSAAIQAYCANPPPNTLLLIVAMEWSRKHEGAWVDAIETVGAAVPVWPLRLAQLPAWIGQRLASRGLEATPEAIEVLIERIEGNLLAAAQEIDKLALLAGGRRLDAATLADLVADSARFDVFKLSDAMLGGDAARALRILAGLRAEGAQVPALLGWLLNQLQLMARLAAAANPAQALRAERSVMGREDFFQRALRRAPRRHWERCLAQAGKVDRLGKGRGDGDAWIELERLLVAVAVPQADVLA